MSTTFPAPLTRFVGRAAELSEAAALLSGARLLTLTGPGGAGKTRLAVQLASRLSEQFPGGEFFVDLSALSGREFVWDQVAVGLGVSIDGSGSAPAPTIGGYLASRRALVVLDNCEHLVESAAEVAAQLLTAAPDLKIIATSREPLGVGGEVTWAVPPMTDVDGLELFSDRARQARPQFSLREKDADAVRSICHRLDGIPLAIELAAARTRAFSPTDIAAGLADRLELLPGGPRTAPARQATLEASFAWSYELLSDSERALLRQCSVFAGGFDLETAMAVCPAAIHHSVAALVDRSLLLMREDPTDGAPRYRMLEPIRQFAAKRLIEVGESAEIRTRHRDHFLALAETAEPSLVGPEEDQWRTRLQAEIDNLRAAIVWSRAQGQTQPLARMVIALTWFWAWPGHLRELAVWIEAAAEVADDLPPRLRSRLRIYQCMTTIVMPGAPGFGEVPAWAAEAVALSRESGDKGMQGLALLVQGLLAGVVGGGQAMRPYLDEGLALARCDPPVGFGRFEALILSIYTMLRIWQSDPDETRRLSEEAVAIAEERADHHTRLFCMSLAGFLALTHGRLADARRLHEATVAGGRASIDSNYLHSLIGVGWACMFQGDFVSAREAIAESLASVQKAGTDSRSITSLEPHARMLMGWMELAEGRPAEAAQTTAALLAVIKSSMVARFAPLPLVIMAQAQMALGEREEAAAFLDEATSVARTGPLTWVLGRVARIRAEMCTQEARAAEAGSLTSEAMALASESGDQMGLVDALELAARLAADQDSHREAVRLWACADSLRGELGYARFPVDRAPHEAAVAHVRQQLGPSAFETAWVEGARLSPDDAVAYAARGRGERKRPTTGWASLTPSELEVARMIGQHLSNPEIASRLFISRATVKTHLVHIFAKLGIDSRSELAAEAGQRSLGSRNVR